MEPLLQELETMRKAAVARVVRIMLICLGIAAAGCVPGYYAIMAWDEDMLPLLAFFAFAVNLVGFIVGSGSFSAYRDEFKKKLIGPLVRRIDPRLTFAADSGIDEEEWAASLLFQRNHRCARYSTEDLIQGEIAGLPVRMAECSASSRHTRRTKNGGTETYYKTIFNGVMLLIETQSALPGPVVILPRTWWVRKGVLSSDFALPFLQCGDAAFDKTFLTFAEPGAAQRLLTPELRQRLVALAKSRKGQVRIGFRDSRIYVAIDESRDLLEPPYYRSILGLDQEAFTKEIRAYTAVVSGLGLQSVAGRHAA